MRQSRPNRVRQRLLHATGPPASAPQVRGAILPSHAADIVIAEYNYAAHCALQAQEDRGRVSSYFLVSGGAAVAAVLGVQSQEVLPTFAGGFATILAVLFLVGFLTLLQLVRLRQFWYDSARAMNRIKEHYQEFYGRTDLARAFVWTNVTLPPPGELWSIAFLLALSVIVVDASLAAGAVIFWGYGTFGDDLLYRNWAIGVGVALAAAQIVLYRLLLRRRLPKAGE